MTNLSASAQKTYNALVAKANYEDGARMPSLKDVSALLSEFNVAHVLSDWSCTKKTSSGSRYSTGGGSKLYLGYRLTVPSARLVLNNTDTYYAQNTCMYAHRLVQLLSA
jgi:hypothetical protein